MIESVDVHAVGRFLTIAFLLSCGGTVETDPAPQLSEAQFAESYAHASCDNLMPCCERAGYSRAMDDCFETVRAEVRSWEGAARAAGGTYDSVAGQQCVEVMRALTDQCLSYKDPVPHPGVCFRVFTGGNKGLGEACTLWDCAGRAGCLVGVASPERVCTAYRIGYEGESCARTDGIFVMCGSGLKCLDGVCSRLHGFGESCPEGSSSDFCETGATCDWHNTKTCVPARAIGESCTEPTQCEGYSCADGTCVRTAMVTTGCVK